MGESPIMVIKTTILKKAIPIGLKIDLADTIIVKMDLGMPD
jgi:hypothetical protein